MKVLSIIHYPVFGGPMNRNAMVAEYLADRYGIRTKIVLPAEPGNAAERFHQMGVDYVKVPLHRIRSGMRVKRHVDLISNYRSDVQALRAVIRGFDADVVLINGSVNPHGAVAAHAEGRAVVWQLLDTFPPSPVLAVAMPYVLRRSHVLMTNGMTVAAAHPGAMAFEGPLLSFGPCISTERFTASNESRRAARAQLGIGQDEFVVGNVNNLNSMKGHVTFVRAAADLAKRRTTRFVILGSRDDSGHAELVEREARAAGLRVGESLIIRDGGSDVHLLSQAFDVFWLTSEPRSEGMSNSLAEAQCLGIPVVVTRTGAVHECMRDGETGFLVAPHDTDALVRHTVTLYDDAELRRKMGAAGASHVRRAFSISRVAETHRQAYESAIERRASGNFTR